ncbi:MAG: serine/threonine-protein kinase, partial [Acidimicrobiales bacterium]
MRLRRRSTGVQSDLFPGFTDVTHIGGGAFSSVYRARELDTDRRVALKLLNVHEVSPHALDSFRRETKALGPLSSHPNIVTLYRTFVTPQGMPVLVLELCRGSVADRVRAEGPLAPSRSVSIAIKIAGALETAHRAGMLHRDVKPQNILVTEYEEPALADFGLARLQSSTEAAAAIFAFTTLHVAPELLEGSGASPATDVYELASSLYQLLSGRAAFRAYDGEAPAAVILRILRDPVAPLVRDGVPMTLSDLLMQAMAKDPSVRPSS